MNTEQVQALRDILREILEKTINNGSSSESEATLQSIENNTDQIEAKLDGTNTFLSEISENTLVLLSLFSGVHGRTSLVATASGNIPSGAYSIFIVASNDFSGTVDEVLFEPNEEYSETAKLDNTLPQLNYTITGGSLTIRYLV